MNYSQYVNFLQAKLEAKELILLIDGVDEAAGTGQTIEEFIHDFLKPTGNRIVVTSRPEGVLLPLSPEQQLIVIQRFLEEDEFLSSLFTLPMFEVAMTTFSIQHLTRSNGCMWNQWNHQTISNWRMEHGVLPSDKRVWMDRIFALLPPCILCIFSRAPKLHGGSCILCRLDDQLKAYSETSQVLKSAAAEKMVGTIMPEDYFDYDIGYSDLRKICVKLCLLHANTQPNTQTLEQLWNHIVSRTAAPYVSAEHCST